jgi:hypothetical protein
MSAAQLTAGRGGPSGPGRGERKCREPAADSKSTTAEGARRKCQQGSVESQLNTARARQQEQDSKKVTYEPGNRYCNSTGNKSFSPVEGANDNISREDKGNEIGDAAALRKGATAVALSKRATTKEEFCAGALSKGPLHHGAAYSAVALSKKATTKEEFRAGALSKGPLCAAAYNAVALSKGATTKEELRAGDVLSKGTYHAAEINDTDVGWTPKKEKRNRRGISTTSGEPQCFGANVTRNPATNQNTWNKTCMYIQLPKREHPSNRPPQFAKYLRTCGKEGAVKIEKEIKHVFPRSAKDKKCNCRDDAVLNEEFDDDVAKDAMELSVFTKMRKMNELEMVKIGLADLFDLPVVDMNQLDIQQKETVFPVEGAQYYNNRTKEQGQEQQRKTKNGTLLL